MVILVPLLYMGWLSLVTWSLLLNQRRWLIGQVHYMERPSKQLVVPPLWQRSVLRV